MRRAAPQPQEDPPTRGRDTASKVSGPYEAPDHDCPTCGIPTTGVLCTSCATR